MKKHLNRIWLGVKTTLKFVAIILGVIVAIFAAEIGLSITTGLFHMYPHIVFTTVVTFGTIFGIYVVGCLRESWDSMDGDDE